MLKKRESVCSKRCEKEMNFSSFRLKRHISHDKLNILDTRFTETVLA